jgi:FMN-dependent NADH-azoreductase
LTPYLRAVFETIGIRSAEFLRLEGLARGPKETERAFDQANTWMECRLPQLLGKLNLERSK